MMNPEYTSQSLELSEKPLMFTTIQAKVPDVLWQKAQCFVQRGWANDTQQLITEALRRYLESYQEALVERFILDDVEWGLRGED